MSNSSSAHCGRWFRGKSNPAGGDRQWIELRASKAAELGRPEFPGGLVFRCTSIASAFFGLAIFGRHPNLS